MIEYARSFMKEIEFNADSVDSLCVDLAKIYACHKAKTLWEECMAAYNDTIKASH